MATAPKLDVEDVGMSKLVPDFLQFTSRLEDPRREHLRVHDLNTILFILLCANMAGITSMVGAADFAVQSYDWLSQYVKLHSTPPTNKTIGRLVAALNPDHMEELLRLVAQHQLACMAPEMSANRPLRHFATDGKVVAGTVSKNQAQTSRANDGQHALMTLNVIDVDTGITIASAGTAEHESTQHVEQPSDAIEVEKSHKPCEHALLKALLPILDLRGTELSVDAAHANRAVTDLIDAVGSARGGDRAHWMICIKGNQYKSRDLIRGAFGPLEGRKIDRYSEHVAGRADTRTTEVIRVAPRYDDDTALRELWPRVKSMIIVKRTRSDRGSIARADKTPTERSTFAYYLSSREHTAHSAHTVIRKHWEVENGLHWILDVRYGEDASQLRERTAARNMAIIRRVAKNLLGQAGGGKGGARDQRRFALNHDFRDQIFKK